MAADATSVHQQGTKAELDPLTEMFPSRRSLRTCVSEDSIGRSLAYREGGHSTTFFDLGVAVALHAIGRDDWKFHADGSSSVAESGIQNRSLANIVICVRFEHDYSLREVSRPHSLCLSA